PFALLCGCVTSHRTTTSFPQPFEFNITDNVAGPKDTIMDKASRWLGKNFIDEHEGIKMNDRKRGKITALGFMTSSSTLCMLTCVPNNYTVQFSMSIIAKDGDYKLVLSNFVLTRNLISEKDSATKTISLNKQKHPFSINRIVW